MILTPEQAADLLQVSPDTVREWARLGKIPARRFGRLWRFDAEELKAWAINPREYQKALERERYNAIRNARNASRRQELRPKLAEYFAWHRASRRRRTPRWTDRSAVRAFYHMARRATDCTGISHTVDHVYPLHGRTVSGLHVPENLRVLPRFQNQSKGNRGPDVPHC